VHYALRVEKK